MTYPQSLQYGYIAVYKIKTRSDYHNILAPSGFNWSTVYQISDDATSYTGLGDNVLFKGTDAICVLAISQVNYTIIPEVKIVTKDVNQ